MLLQGLCLCCCTCQTMTTRGSLISLTRDHVGNLLHMGGLVETKPTILGSEVNCSTRPPQQPIVNIQSMKINPYIPDIISQCIKKYFSVQSEAKLSGFNSMLQISDIWYEGLMLPTNSRLFNVFILFYVGSVGVCLHRF